MEMNVRMARLEIIVETLEDAVRAEAAGATQLDLTADSPKGGVTQSAGMIERVCGTLELPIMVMIRPHARGFAMSEADIETMCSDICIARSLGAKHFLLGCLDEKGNINREAYRRFQDAAGDGCTTGS